MNTTIIGVIGSAVITLHIAMCLYEYKKDFTRWWNDETPKETVTKRKKRAEELNKNLKPAFIKKYHPELLNDEGLEEMV